MPAKTKPANKSALEQPMHTQTHAPEATTQIRLDASQKFSNHALPTVWVDSAEVLVRSDPAVAMLRFYTLTPEGAIEACRIETPIAHLRSMAQVITRVVTAATTRQAESAPSHGQ